MKSPAAVPSVFAIRNAAQKSSSASSILSTDTDPSTRRQTARDDQQRDKQRGSHRVPEAERAIDEVGDRRPEDRGRREQRPIRHGIVARTRQLHREQHEEDDHEHRDRRRVAEVEAHREHVRAGFAQRRARDLDHPVRDDDVRYAIAELGHVRARIARIRPRGSGRVRAPGAGARPRACRTCGDCPSPGAPGSCGTRAWSRFARRTREGFRARASGRDCA